MGNISPQNFAALIFKYLDTERLMRDNPSVTKEMVEKYFQELVRAKEGKASTGIHLPHSDASGHKQKDIHELIIHTDGASRGNPGKSGIGVAIFDKDHRLIEEACRFTGESTNNVAEYKAMILAAQKAIAYNARKVTFKADSELLVRQINGYYRVKSQNILPLYQELTKLLKKIPEWKIQHVRREENECADNLANKGIDSCQ